MNKKDPDKKDEKSDPIDKRQHEPIKDPNRQTPDGDLDKIKRKEPPHR